MGLFIERVLCSARRTGFFSVGIGQKWPSSYRHHPEMSRLFLYYVLIIFTQHFFSYLSSLLPCPICLASLVIVVDYWHLLALLLSAITLPWTLNRRANQTSGLSSVPLLYWQPLATVISKLKDERQREPMLVSWCEWIEQSEAKKGIETDWLIFFQCGFQKALCSIQCMILKLV